MKNTQNVFSNAIKVPAFILASLLVLLIIPTSLLKGHAYTDTTAQVEITFNKDFDGTGHGTDRQTYITTANGFEVGDDDPHDNVVTSGDTVQYTLNVHYLPGDARTVTITPQNSEFFTVVNPQVWTETLVRNQEKNSTYTLTLKAEDTHGLTLSEVASVSIKTSLNSTENIVELDNTTITSQPYADLILSGGGTTYGSLDQFFEIRPVALKVGGTNNTKGSSTGGPWSGTLDVTEMPAATQWFVKDNNGEYSLQIFPNNGLLPISENSGQSQYLKAVLPEFNGSYALHINVDPTSFTVNPLYPNNGTGTQPGDGLSGNDSTHNNEMGSSEGTYFLNNDWTYVENFRNETTYSGVPTAFSIATPSDPTVSIFNQRNITGGSDVEITEYLREVAPSTEMYAHFENLADFTNYGNNPNTDYALVYSVSLLNPSIQTLEENSNVPEITLNDQVLTSDLYIRQWSSTPKSNSEILDASNNTGWVTGTPDSTAVVERIVIPHETLETFDYVGYSHVYIGITNKSASEISSVLVPGETSTVSSYQLLAGTTSGYYTSNILQNTVVLDYPASQGIYVYPLLTWNNRDIIAGNQTLNNGPSGQLSLYGVTPNKEYSPTLRYELDPCVSLPVVNRDTLVVNNAQNSQQTWSYTIQDPIPGSDGKICGSSDSTGYIIDFTLSNWMPPGGANESADISLPRVSVTPNATLKSYYYVSYTATFNMNDADYPEMVGTSAPVRVFTQTEDIVSVHEDDFPLENNRVNLGEDFSYDASLITLNSSTQQSLETVFILPQEGDNQYLLSYANSSTYFGPTESSFTNKPTLSSAYLDMSNSSTNAELYFTTDILPTFNPADSSWYLVSDAGLFGNPTLDQATALRVFVPADASSTLSTAAQLRITMSQGADSQPGDSFVLWTGPTVVNGGTRTIERPQPVYMIADTYNISGDVYWDDDLNGRWSASDPQIPNVPISIYTGLYDSIPDSSIAPYITLLTASDGSYSTSVPQGEYTIVVSPPSGDTLGLDRWGNQLYEDVAYSSYRKFINMIDGALPSNVFTVTATPGNSFGTQVGFKRANYDPSVDVSTIDSNCSAATADDSCSANWSVTITNNGNKPLTGDLNVNINTPDIVFGTNDTIMATTTNEIKWKETLSGNNTSLLLDENGRLYYLGNDFLGDPKIEPVIWTPTASMKFKDIIDSAEYGMYYAIDTDDKVWVLSVNGMFEDADNSDNIAPLVDYNNVQLTGKNVYSDGAGDLFVLDLNNNLWSGTNPLSLSGGYGGDLLGRGSGLGMYELFGLVIDDNGTPITVDNVFVAINWGNTSILATDVNGGIWAWGSVNSPIYTETGTSISYSTPQKSILDDSKHYSAIYPTSNKTYFVTDDGYVYVGKNNPIVEYGDVTPNDGGSMFVFYSFDNPTLLSYENKVLKITDMFVFRNRFGFWIDNGYILANNELLEIDINGNLLKKYEDTDFSSMTDLKASNEYPSNNRFVYATNSSGEAIFVDGYYNWESYGFWFEGNEYFTMKEGEFITNTKTGENIKASNFGFIASSVIGSYISSEGELYLLGTDATYSMSIHAIWDIYQQMYSNGGWASYRTSPRKYLMYDLNSSDVEITPVISRDSERTYVTIPVEGLFPGTSMVVNFDSTVYTQSTLPTTQENLLVQGWYSGVETPIQEILPNGKIQPDYPTDPGALLTLSGVLGNMTCSSDPEQIIEDQCDQVGAVMPFITTSTPTDPTDPNDPVDPTNPTNPSDPTPVDNPTNTNVPTDRPTAHPVTGSSLYDMIFISSILILIGTGSLLSLRKTKRL